MIVIHRLKFLPRPRPHYCCWMMKIKKKNEHEEQWQAIETLLQQVHWRQMSFIVLFLFHHHHHIRKTNDIHYENIVHKFKHRIMSLIEVWAVHMNKNQVEIICTKTKRYHSCLDPTMPQPIGLNTFLVQTSAKKNPTSSLSRRSKRFSADIESLSNCKSEKNSSLTRTSKTEPFYLSTDDSSLGAPMQTSTLIISTPPQYHYYLYPPSISKKNSSMNSISTSSNSSSSSYDLDDDTLSNATYSVINPTTNPPMVLSDSVQNFWPPPPSPSTFDNDSDDTLIEQVILFDLFLFLLSWFVLRINNHYHGHHHHLSMID